MQAVALGKIAESREEGEDVKYSGKGSGHNGYELTVCRQLDYDGIRAEAIRDRAVVIPKVRGYGIEQRDSADDPLAGVFLLHVERRIVRREIELATSEAPYHRVRFWHRYRGTLHLRNRGGTVE